MVVKNLKLIGKYCKLNFQKEFQYKSAFFTKVLMMILNNAFFILQWVIIFGVIDDIGGYGFQEVMLLWGLSAGAYGVSHVFFENAFNIGNLVYEGRLDVYLTQPKNVLINLICSETSVSAWGDIIYTFIALALAGASWWWYLAIIPVSIIGGIIYTAVIVCFQSISFYVKRGSSVADMINSSITLFADYPPVIFNSFIKILQYTIIPCGFMVFIPAEFIFLGFDIWCVLTILLFAIFTVSLAFAIFHKGLKKYNSGSLMGGRL